MGFSAITYALAIKNAKKYTDEQNIVTLEWENEYGDKRESKIYIDDGTPIYNWTSGRLYIYGDLAIYDSRFYRCITANKDLVFDPAKWNEIGGSDGNYSIIDTIEELPDHFASSDRKMYYCIEDGYFYLWDGEQWIEQQPSVIPYDEISKLFN